MEKEWLFGKTLGELAEVAASFGMPRFTATQIAAGGFTGRERCRSTR